MTETGKKTPGSARAPGSSIAETLRSDTHPASAALLEEKNDFLGDQDIDPRRYFSQPFFQSEMDKMWPKTWQWACREEHIPDVGDNYVYDIGDYSVIVVRADEHTIKAFLNSCT